MHTGRSTLDFHFQSVKEKSQIESGEAIARYIEEAIRKGYYNRRNARIEKNRLFSRGRQPMKEFLDLMMIDGKESFVNLDMMAPAIAPKFMNVLYGSFMNRSEKPIATAVDPISTKKKIKDKRDAKFRMDNKDFIAQIQQEAGVQLEPQDAFTPEDNDEFELFFNLEYRLPEEILFERGIKTVLDHNRWNVIKKKLLEDLCEAGFAATRVYTAPNGAIKIRRVIPENLIYSHSEHDDFRDASFLGEIVTTKIRDMRDLYPNLTEEEVFQIAQTSKNYVQTMKWDERYRYSPDRPYDDWSVDVIEFEVKSTDSLIYQARKNKFGNMVVEKKDRMPQRVGENKEIISKDTTVIYRGAYVRGLRKLIDWGLAKNMIKSNIPQELSEVQFSYSIFMYENLDLENKPLIERSETSIRQLTLIHLKIQQMIAKMRPSGLLVDVDGLDSVDLGTGKALQPLEIQRIYDQTGNLYYRSKSEDGDSGQRPPIMELANNGSVGQLQQLIQSYNFYLERMRDELGINEYREGTSVNPKLGLGVMNAQIQASNNATEFIYDGFISLFENTCSKAALLMYDSVLYGGKQYRDIMNEEQIKDRYFAVKIEILPDEKERQYLEAMIQTALSAGMIEFEDAFRIRRIENTKLAEMYLAKAKKKRQQEKMKEAQANSQMNGQIQMQSAQAKMQADMQLEQLQGQNKVTVVSAEHQMKQDLAMQDFVTQALLKAFELGKDLPPQLQQIVDGYFQTKAQNEAAAQQAAMQQAMMQQQGQGGEEQGEMEEEQEQGEQSMQ